MADVSERLSSLVDAFLAREGLERGLADNTLEAYGRDLTGFRVFLAQQGLERWEHLEAKHVRGFVEELERQNLAPRSRSRALVFRAPVVRVCVRRRTTARGSFRRRGFSWIASVAAEGAAPGRNPGVNCRGGLFETAGSARRFYD